MGEAAWDFDARWKGSKECRNKVRELYVGALNVGLMQGYRDQRENEGCPEMEKWRPCQAEMQRVVDLQPRLEDFRAVWSG